MAKLRSHQGAPSTEASTTTNANLLVVSYMNEITEGSSLLLYLEKISDACAGISDFDLTKAYNDCLDNCCLTFLLGCSDIDM